MKEKIILKELKDLGGNICHTTSLRYLLMYKGIPISEPMLLGLGGGIGFFYFYSKSMPAPIIAPFSMKVSNFIPKICERLNVKINFLQTESIAKAYEELKNVLREGNPAYVLGDMAYLPYLALPKSAHFGDHSFVIYGIDEEKGIAYVQDRSKKSLQIKLEELEKARNSKSPPFQPKNRIIKIEISKGTSPSKKAIFDSIKECCDNMLHPPVKMMGLEGMKKMADAIPKWSEQFKGFNLLMCLINVFIYLEVSGAGEGGFRKMYGNFLEEVAQIFNKKEFNEIAKKFKESSKMWTEVAKSALPDSWKSLKNIRELISEKNRIFEEKGPEALEKMNQLNKEIDANTKTALMELNGKKEEINKILSDIRQKIIQCSEFEKEIFENLETLVNKI